MKRNLAKSILALFLIGLLTTCLFAQEAALPSAEESATETVPTTMSLPNDNESMSGLEIFARKLVGGYLVTLFIDGGWLNWPILFLFIWGMAMSIWKIVSLSYAKINVTNFLNKVLPLIKDKKYKEALEVCDKTRGPVSAVVYAGLLKTDRGVASVEKAIENAATIEMATLEKQFINMSSVINLAPMVGFFGTILGMRVAFDAIAAAGDVDPTIVADGISIALVTTMTGLSVAIPVQFFYNLSLQMVDGLVLDMQRAIDKITETYVENK